MIDFISMVATVTSTILQWLDYSQSQQKNSSQVLDSFNNQDDEQILESKIKAIISGLKQNQETINKSVFGAIIICLFVPIWLTNNGDIIVGDISSSFLDKLLFIISLALLVVCSYGFLIGTARFLIQREINYYSLDKNGLSKLKLALADAKWKNSTVKWFLKESLMGIRPSPKSHD
jgi:hypothetical protein